MSRAIRDRQARAQVSAQIALVGGQAAKRQLARVAARLRSEGLLPKPSELPSLLREQVL
jgi:hypothetical protein